MDGGELCPPEDLEELLAQIQRDQGLTYAPLQVEAVKTAARRQVMLLTGGPGTGKTTSLRGILALFDHLGLRTALTAPTGRAAKRLGETCGAEASTIHRLLETRYDGATGGLTFAHNQREPLDTDAVILDEASMVDVVLMQAPAGRPPRGLPPGAGGGPPPAALGGAGEPAVRPAPLPAAAHPALDGDLPPGGGLGHHPGGPGGGRGAAAPTWSTTPRGTASSSAASGRRTRWRTIVDLCRRRLPQNLGIPSDQIQVLSPTGRGRRAPPP